MKNNREKINQLYDSVHSIDYIYESYAKSQGIPYNEMLFFYVLLEENQDCITQKQICDKLDIPKTTVNSLVKNLIKKEFVILEQSKNNKKEKFVTLTKQGKEYAEQLILPLFKCEEEAISHLTTKDIEEFQRIQSVFGLHLKKNLKL